MYWPMFNLSRRESLGEMSALGRISGQHLASNLAENIGFHGSTPGQEAGRRKQLSVLFLIHNF